MRGSAGVAPRGAGHDLQVCEEPPLRPAATVTNPQLRRALPHREAFGYAHDNVRFLYRGTIPEHRSRFVLDKHHDIEAGRVFPVCGNTWRMLADTRFRAHFDFIGSFDRHYGLFEGCGAAMPFGRTTADDDPGCACC